MENIAFKTILLKYEEKIDKYEEIFGKILKEDIPITQLNFYKQNTPKY